MVSHMVRDLEETGQKLALSCHTYLVQKVLDPHLPELKVSLQLKLLGFSRGTLAGPSGKVVVT